VFYGFVAEDQHFANVVQGLEEPLETGEDGKAVLEIISAAYESAGKGRNVALPFTPPAMWSATHGLKPASC
jgi:predicted dehydrogenase